ncbi:MAG: hypothetical protein V7677_19040 [Motiliproteus sp.]
MTIKDRINKLIGIYLAELESISHDAGWRSDTMLARAIMYVGDIPPPSGNDTADNAMIEAIEMIRSTHAKFQLAQLLISKLTYKQRVALLASRYYDNKLDDQGLTMTDQRIASKVKMDLREFRYYRDKSYKAMQPNMELALDVQRIGRVA